MVELCARLILSGLAVFLSGVAGPGGPTYVDASIAWKGAIVSLAIGFFVHRIEARGLRTPEISIAVAVIDASIIAVFLASGPLLPQAGALVLIPMIWAAVQHRANPHFVGPLAALTLVLADCATHRAFPATPVFIQTLCVLLASLVVKVPPQPLGNLSALPMPPSAADDNALLEIREKYRNLRDAYADLDHRTRRDRLSAALSEARLAPDGQFFSEFARVIGELTGSPELVLYTVASYGQAMTVKATYGDLPEELQGAALEVDLRTASGLLREKSEEAVEALRQIDGMFANVILNHRGKIVGLVCLVHSHRQALENARLIAEEAAPQIASMVLEGIRRENSARRLREAELLYDLSTLHDYVGREGNAKEMAAQRLVKEMSAGLQTDHLAITLLQGGSPKRMALEGFPCDLVTEMSFGSGPGLVGWREVGCPELLLFDVRGDSRCPSQAALRSRVGTYVVIPITEGAEVVGFVSAATARVGGIDLASVETLRVTCSELGRFFSLCESSEEGGLVTSSEFGPLVQVSASEGQTGSLIVLEPLKRDSLYESFGRPAIGQVVQRYLRMVRAKLPPGGIVCRRPNDDVVAFLPRIPVPDARRWANEMAASASLLGVRASDGTTRIPFAIRAKVADFPHALTPDSRQVSDNKSQARHFYEPLNNEQRDTVLVEESQHVEFSTRYATPTKA